MEQIHFERLQKLADHLMSGELGHKKFSLATFNDGRFDENGCGSVGCAIGECPILFPQDWQFHHDHVWDLWEPTLPEFANRLSCSFDSAVEYFGLSKEEASHLFFHEQQDVKNYGGKDLTETATREEVAQNLYAFISIKNNRNDNASKNNS